MLLSLLLLSPYAEAAPAGQMTKPPELVHFVEATFPESEAGHTGSVVLAVTIKDDGTVEDATIQESAGEAFDAAAIEAVKQFQFTPAEIDGKPSRIRILYRYDFVEKAAVPTTAIFAGVVLDQDTGQPLADVTVSLSSGKSAVTGLDGHFEIDEVEPGTATITLEGAQLTALSTEENFVAGQRLDAKYEVVPSSGDEEDLEILVIAPTIKKQAVSTVIAADQARKVPGTSGDVLKVVENMPGVARSSLGSGALVVWGAAPGDTGVYVDGVPVPRLYHDGGLRSVVGSDFVNSVELVPGGYGAAYGRGLGGLVSAKTNSFDDKLHGSVAADVYDASGSIHGPIDRTVDLGIAARASYVGPLLSTFYPDVEDFFPIPHYYDTQGRVGIRLAEGERIDITGLVSSDRTASTAPSPDPLRQASEEKELQFQRVYARYTRDVGEGETTTITVFAGNDHNNLLDTYGNIETGLDQHAGMVGVRGSYRSHVAKWLVAEGGVDSLVTTTDIERHGSVAVPTREGDVYVFGEPPPDQISTDSFTVTTYDVAPYIEMDAALFSDSLHLIPGLRVDPYARSVSLALPQIGDSPTHGLITQDFHVEPRLQVRWAPTERSHVTFATGQYGAQPSPPDLSASFGNPELPATDGTHYVLGAGASPAKKLTVEATGFYTASYDLAERNQAETPAIAEALRPTGSGRTYGGQALVRLDPPSHPAGEEPSGTSFFGWVSYTLGWSERQDVAGEAWRPSDYDQRHVLTALSGLDLPHGFDAGVRARVASGFPRSSVTGSTYDSRRDLYLPIFGGHNDIRLPTFFQLDVRVAKTFDFRDSQLEISFEVQNATNQQNVEEYIYSADYSERGAITGLPLLPVLGLRWSF